MIFHWLALYNNDDLFPLCGACSEVVCEIEHEQPIPVHWESNAFQLLLACQNELTLNESI